jgi:DNA replication protein DnaC
MIEAPYGWLYLYGGPGNAKSEVLMAIVNELNLAGRGPALYLKFSYLLNRMRAAFAEQDYHHAQARAGLSPEQWQNLGYLERFERLKAVPVLAIDELDKVRLTEFGLEFTFDFLDERYRQAIHGQTVTLFAGQTCPDDLPAPLSSRIYDGRFQVIHNPAGDARPAMRR